MGLKKEAHSNNHDSRQDATGIDAQPPGREKLLVMLIGTDAGSLNLGSRHTCLKQFPAVGFPQIYMVFART